ncbi:MAG: NADH:ubiquinone reductase (Na(+)-transporting) subunit A, partial [Prevotellaceae bacterium]|nr:NADH:ubiquinone reductase (Na(+)-transporting) subunit A [Prevotellaceae bacterium]
WPNIKQRPYGIVANPDHVPKAIFVSAFDTAPLAPDLDFILENEEEMLQTGIDILNKLSPNGLNWSISHRSPTGGVVRKVKNVHFYEFEGKHPSSNVGVQIHHIAPISKGEVVWTIDPQALVIIGRLFATGRLDARKVVAITGPAAQRPCYVSLLSGTPLSSLSKIGLNNSKVRYISGNCLTGDNVGYDGSIGFYHHQITMLPEGDHSEIFGWAKVIRSNTYSVNRSYLSSMTRKKRFSLDTNLHGGVRAFVLSDVYKKVLPMNIYPTYLLKAILVQDIDKMEALGIYEVIEEDFALCEFVCPSKIDIQEIVAQGIELMIKEMS